MPLREKVDFLNPIVGVIYLFWVLGSIIRERIVVLPLLSNPISINFPSEFPMIIFFVFFKL